ncbi:MAG: K(+)-transporting ATPase subunit F [Pseudomonadota bacterium]|jgi:K+-transporting ATPase KdpF subunit
MDVVFLAVVAGTAGVGLLAYLVYALFNAETF